MNLFPIVPYLLATFLSSTLSKYCSDEFGDYDEPPSEGCERDEKIPNRLWTIIGADEERDEEIWISEKENCPMLYQRYSTDHTYCKTSTCDTLSAGVTDEDKKFILEMHNSLRSKLASGNETRYRQLPPAANMMQMEWDEELAQIAQAHTNHCVYQHDRNDQRAVENFPVGQNLMLTSGGGKHWILANGWYKQEVCFFSPERIKPFTGGRDGHFTQVTWATTWKIGCGFAGYKQGGIPVSFYACNYGPTGNIGGGTHYIVGEPCSQCPKNTECSTEYPGLCKSKTEDGPQKERPSPDKFLLYCDFSNEDPEECNEIEITGSRNFSERHMYSGNYKTVVLHARESITIDFGRARNEEGICLMVYIRFGPDNATDPAGSRLEFYIGPTWKRLQPFIYGPTRPFVFSLVRITSIYGGEQKSYIKLVVKEDAAPQFFDIKAWGLQKGRCDWSL